MPSTPSDNSASPRRATGRPRRLTLIQIIAAGVELGLEELSVSALALRLGVSVGTIYTYVENRDELVRLVAAAIGRRAPIEDHGQHWSDIARDHAARMFELLANTPALLAHMVKGDVEADETFPEIEHFLGLLGKRGFSPEAAARLYHQSGQLAVGAAVAATMASAWARRGGSRRVRMAQILAEEPDAYPLTRGLVEMMADNPASYDYRLTLEAMLRQIAEDRGEVLADIPSE